MRRPQPPISPAEVASLRARQHEPGFSVLAEARRLGRNAETIRRLLRGETYVAREQAESRANNALETSAETLARFAADLKTADPEAPLRDLLRKDPK